MSIQFACACGKSYKVADEMAGKRVRCKACGQPLEVPRPEAEDDYGAYDLAGAAEAEGEAVGTAVAPPAAPLPRGPELVGAYGTVASNPSLIRVDWVKYFSCFPAGPVIWLIMLALAPVAAARGVPVVALIVLGVIAINAFQQVRRVRQTFLGGDVNPGVVISQNPYTIAVHVDMSAAGRGRRYDAVKIIDQPLGRMTGGPPAVGTLLATAALYYGSPSETWRNVDPIVVNCVTRDEAAIQRMMASIPRSAWAALDAALARVPDRKPGLYRLWDGKQTVAPAGMVQWVLSACLIAAIAGPILFGKPRARPASSSRSESVAAVQPSEPAPEQPAPESRGSPAPMMPSPEPAAAPARSRGAGSRVSELRARAAERRAASEAAARPTPGLAADAAPPRTTFPAEDKVQVLWGATWYAATIQKRENGKVFILYDGWGDSFSEWVTPDRVRPRP